MAKSVNATYRNRISARLFLLGLILLPAGALHATSIVGVSVPQMLKHSHLVFQGKVIGKESRWNEAHNRIHTFVTFEVEDVIKGNYNKKQIRLSFAGGTVGDTSLQISDMRYPKMGEEGVYFVESLSKQQVNPLYGWSQGHFLILRDSTGRRRIATQGKRPIRQLSSSEASAPQQARHFGGGAAARGLVFSKKGLDHAMSLTEFKKELRTMRR